MSNEPNEISCKECEPAFQAFLEEMAAHNQETIEELRPKTVCPICGKIHEYGPNSSDEGRRAS